ncbi:MAG: TetR/AcrR family transcriptional regulator [Myxococcota bacterium]
MSRSESKANKRKAILDAARQVFYREDYLSANIDEVARIADVSKGSIYRYFPSKAALYVWVLGQDSKDFFSAAERRVARTDPLPTADRIRKLWNDYAEHWIRNPDAFRIFWALDNEELIGELPSDLSERIAENWKRSLEITKDVLDEGVRRGEIEPIDTWLAAQAFWTQATALLDHDNSRGRRKIRGRPFRETYGFAIELLLRGMLVDRSESKLAIGERGESDRAEESDD